MMISLVLGAIFIFLGVRFAQWAVATLSGRAFDTRTTWLSGERAGQTVAYWELVGRVAWTEMGTFAMGVALLLDSVVICLATRGGAVRRPLVAAAMAITAVAVLANLGLSATLFSDGVTPLFSIIAVLVGAFMLFDHWALLTGRSD